MTTGTVHKNIVFYFSDYYGSRTVLLPVNVRDSRPDLPKPRDFSMGSHPAPSPVVLAGGRVDCAVGTDEDLF